MKLPMTVSELIFHLAKYPPDATFEIKWTNDEEDLGEIKFSLYDYTVTLFARDSNLEKLKQISRNLQSILEGNLEELNNISNQ
jgi:hypothetical protein